MNLIDLYRNESENTGATILFMAMISGVANAAILGIINSAVSVASYDTLNFRYLMLYFVAFLIFVLGIRYSLTRTTAIMENIIKKVRLRITDKLRQSDLLFLENIGNAEIYTRITQDTNLISQSAAVVIKAAQSIIMLVFCILYIAWLSKLAFVITVIFIGIGISVFMVHRKITIGLLQETTVKESRFFEMLNTSLDGFKELKVNQKRNDAFFSDIKAVADDAEDIKIQTGLRFIIGILFSEVCFYMLIASIVFLLPRMGVEYSAILIRLVTAILFIMGPLDLIVSAIPIFTRSNVAVNNLYELEEKIDKATRDGSGTTPFARERFSTIEFENVLFQYTDANGHALFTVGPVNLTIRQGEILFVIGGNGSGKSTFLKLLTGLYYPVSGRIRLDGQEVNQANYQTFRELFSIIFTDFHLFDKLYGLDMVDTEKVAALLSVMKLDKKTTFKDGAFSNIHLSTGQRKRLAMVVALLFDSEIFVFDEWAADQDPDFRKYYYNVLLQELKKRGKTVIAVSHDDRYFDTADRVMKMDYGQFNGAFEETKGGV